MSRLLSFGFILFSFFFLVGQNSFAQTPASTQNTYAAPTINTNSFNSYGPELEPGLAPNLSVLTQGIMLETLAAVSCQLAGIDPLAADGKCLYVDSKTRKLTKAENVGGGAITFVSHAIGGTFNIPVSSSQYAYALKDQFGISKSAYAQETGYGFRSLGPILQVWKAFRNLVFLFFVLIFSAIGIGIMFRFKMDARTVMTIQNQIPKLTIGLVLITFSYAIAGFLIDMMYVVVYLFINVGSNVYSTSGLGSLSAPSLNSTPFGFVNSLYSSFEIPIVGFNTGIIGVAGGASGSVGNIITGLFDGFLDSVLGSAFKLLISPMGVALLPVKAVCSMASAIPHLSSLPLLGVIDKIPVIGSIPLIGGGGPECGLPDAVANIGQSIIKGIVSLLAFIVILVAILVSLFRLWFALIKAYLFILLDIVFAPFWIAAGLLPGGGLGFGAWFRDVLANLAVFPVVIGILIIGRIFIDAFGNTKGDYFVPPLIGNPGDPSEIGTLIGLGMILLTPQLIDTVKGMLKTKSPNFPSIATAIGAGRAGEGALRGGLTKKFWHRNHTTGELEGPVGEWAQGHGNKMLRFALGVKHWNRPPAPREVAARQAQDIQRANTTKTKTVAAIPHNRVIDPDGMYGERTDEHGNPINGSPGDTPATPEEPSPDGDSPSGGSGGMMRTAAGYYTGATPAKAGVAAIKSGIGKLRNRSGGSGGSTTT